MTSIRIGKLLFVLCLAARLCAAADISVELSVDKATVSEGEAVQLEVAVKGTQGAGQPEIGGLDAFDVQSTGSSTQFQMINGVTSTQTVFSFMVSPKKIGSFRIGPATVSVGGNTYTSAPVEIRVTKGQAGGSAAAGGGTDNDNAEETTASAPRGDFRVTAQADEKSPFVNGQTIYTFRFYSRGPMQGASLSLPEFKGFFKEQLGKQRDSRELVNGVPYDVTEIRFALFPLSPGAVTIPPAVLTGQVLGDSPRRRRRGGGGLFDEFFDDPMLNFGGPLKPVRLRTEALTLNVRPFPSGKPSDFNGLVGHFKLETSIGKKDLAVGDSTTLSLKLSGEGNVRDARLPTVEWKGFKTYEDKPSVDNEVGHGGKLGGSKTFRIALVPLAGGQIKLPPISLSYLDPTTGRYEHLESEPLILQVTPGAVPESLSHVSASPTGNVQKEIQVQGEDVMPLKRELTDAGSGITDAERLSLIFLIFGLPVLYLPAWGYARRRAGRNEKFLRRERAFRKFQAALKGLEPGNGFYEGASLVFRTYVGDKLGFDGKALTPADAERKLRPLGVTDPTVKGVEAVLKRLERGQYGGAAATPEEASQLRGELEQVGKRLQTEVSK